MKTSGRSQFQRRSLSELGLHFLVSFVAASTSFMAAGAEATGLPSREQLLSQARRCREILRTSLIDFYLPACVDKANGGFLESLRDGKFAASGEKFLTIQGAYHNGRAMILCATMLEELAAKASQ